MSEVWNKLDSGLSEIYSNYLEVQKHGVPRGQRLHPAAVEGGRLQVSLQYTGELREIEALGFETLLEEEPGLAQGTVDLADLERLAAHRRQFGWRTTHSDTLSGGAWPRRAFYFQMHRGTGTRLYSMQVVAFC